MFSCLRWRFPVSWYTGRIVSSSLPSRLSNDSKISTIPEVSLSLSSHCSLSQASFSCSSCSLASEFCFRWAALTISLAAILVWWARERSEINTFGHN